MSNDPLYRGNTFLGLAYPEAFADPTAPTAAELNSALVIDLTCALDEDGTEFTLGDSETDDSVSFCDTAGKVNPTTKNATIKYVAFRDQDRVATGYYNKAFNHLAFKGIPFYAVERVGKANNASFAIGDRVRIVAVTTDNPTDDVAVDKDITLTQAFAQAGLVNWNFKVVA